MKLRNSVQYGLLAWPGSRCCRNFPGSSAPVHGWSFCHLRSLSSRGCTRGSMRGVGKATSLKGCIYVRVCSITAFWTWGQLWWCTSDFSRCLRGRRKLQLSKNTLIPHRIFSRVYLSFPELGRRTKTRWGRSSFWRRGRSFQCFWWFCASCVCGREPWQTWLSQTRSLWNVFPCYCSPRCQWQFSKRHRCI